MTAIDLSLAQSEAARAYGRAYERALRQYGPPDKRLEAQDALRSYRLGLTDFEARVLDWVDGRGFPIRDVATIAKIPTADLEALRRDALNKLVQQMGADA